MKKSRKAQNSTEFAVLATFMMFVFIIFFLIIQQKLIIANKEKTADAAQQLQNSIVNEIKLAGSVSDHYSREFTLPNNINGVEYTVEIMAGPGSAPEIVIKYDTEEIVYFLDNNITGASTIGIGSNTITKNSGWIQIQHN